MAVNSLHATLLSVPPVSVAPMHRPPQYTLLSGKSCGRSGKYRQSCQQQQPHIIVTRIRTRAAGHVTRSATPGAPEDEPAARVPLGRGKEEGGVGKSQEAMAAAWRQSRTPATCCNTPTHHGRCWLLSRLVAMVADRHSRHGPVPSRKQARHLATSCALWLPSSQGSRTQGCSSRRALLRLPHTACTVATPPTCKFRVGFSGNVMAGGVVPFLKMKIESKTPFVCKSKASQLCNLLAVSCPAMCSRSWLRRVLQGTARA